MNGAARIRFVIPTLGRNVEWLEKTLKSVTRQQVSVSLVVISPPNSAVEALAGSFGARFEIDKGRGLSAAINQGFRSERHSYEEYLTWLGDDDILAPNALARAVVALDSKPSASLVIGRVRYIDEAGKSKWVVRSGSWSVWYSRLGQNFMAQPGSLIRRSSFDKVGGLDEGLRNSMDQDLFLRLSQVGSVCYIPFEVAAFRVHSGSISSTKGSFDERKFVSARYRPQIPKILNLPLRAFIRASDRVLLSSLRRIPHARAEMIDGEPYHI